MRITTKNWTDFLGLYLPPTVNNHKIAQKSMLVEKNNPSFQKTLGGQFVTAFNSKNHCAVGNGGKKNRN